ncbi:MAG TPA: fused MFS/spermidine synthase [Gemmatimonadales bacterium]|nr:fused MFS/spermidine synthase [Gemmatimonadales bacterium]
MSGATGLVYELLWVRLLYQTFGSTIQSVTTVVAAYMGGLGLGAWLLGRHVDRHPRPAALYGVLEIAIGVFGLVSPLVLGLAHRVYVGAASAWPLSGGASVALRFGLAALVLLVPTTLMGGTLPVLTRAFTGVDRGALKPSLGRLYGLNTLGAMAGTALAGFVLIELAGIRLSLWGTAAINIILGLAAIALARPLPPSPEPPPPVLPAVAPAGRRDALAVTALALLACTAFASLLNEIAWTRVLVMVVGGSTYAFTLVLLVFLLGIGLGSALVGRRATARSETAAAAALAQGVTGAGAALLLLFFSVLPRYVLAVFQHQGFDASTRLLLMGVAVGSVVLIPAIGMGLTFPLLTDLTARPDAARGADVGRAYGLNTLGAIAGAVLTGFVLVVALGSETTLRIGLVINGVAALVLAGFAARGVAERSAEHRALRVRVLGAGALASVALGVALAAPGWSSRLIDLAPTIYGRAPMNAAERQAFLTHAGSRQLAFQEGWNATVSVWETSIGRSLRVNGKVDASDYADMNTQILSGLAPAAARAGASSALVIGYGSGVTARVLADVPGMRRLRIVEIEPAVLGASPYFASVNHSVLERPEVTVVADDARSALQLHDERFDVITSEPSNPWVAGVATLYTPEFFHLLRTRLADDGVFCQWMQLYQLPLPIVAGIVRNVREVFPQVELWFSNSVDVLIIASGRPIRYDRTWLERLLAPATSIGELGHEWLGIDSVGDYFGRRLLGDAGAAWLSARATLVHRDDRPELEFVAARRFLDPPGAGPVFDSLLAIAASAGETPGGSPVQLARAVTAPGVSPARRAVIEAAHQSRPEDPIWAVRVAQVRLELGDSTYADSVLPALLTRARHPEALRVAAAVAERRGDTVRTRELLTAALARGGDTAAVRAKLAGFAAVEGRWAEAGRGVRAALAVGSGTYRRPLPVDALGEVLRRFANHGPPDLADSLLVEALAVRPGWARLYALRATAALRLGQCSEASAHFLALLEFGIRVAEAPESVARCSRGERP